MIINANNELIVIRVSSKLDIPKSARSAVGARLAPLHLCCYRSTDRWLLPEGAAPNQVLDAGHATGRPVGARNERADMERRYTSGKGRRGERREQLSLRIRIVRAVAESIADSPLQWYELPRSLDSWDILV